MYIDYCCSRLSLPFLSLFLAAVSLDLLILAVLYSVFGSRVFMRLVRLECPEISTSVDMLLDGLEYTLRDFYIHEQHA